MFMKIGSIESAAIFGRFTALGWMISFNVGKLHLLQKGPNFRLARSAIRSSCRHIANGIKRSATGPNAVLNLVDTNMHAGAYDCAFIWHVGPRTPR
jgi:hypothetical protein